ncbi:hypothetical protein H8M03_02175 [Sphingomonas sabuli]|uniref:Nuclear transport factor 2 family protein n=1 Tax=Sphingomonas sabuli TaxID=2764186 RepID=A0A7G9L3I6_9SPHN|nr:hypothetical protein [Sphingomonas sabuli]QNM83185.1 hypothetical protein H8M03_02175 [Sphingomonas sabuli]
MLTLLAAAMLVPPPVAGDDRTAILASVNSLIDALATSDGEAVDALLESEGTFVRVDLTNPAAASQRVTSFADIRKDTNKDVAVMSEKLGIPTLMQRGPIAYVWVPYGFFTGGKLSHCGIDAFTLVNRDDRWRVAGLVYTVEATSTCAALAAPTTPE